MIEEVAILSGHDNDGKLSFRDYIGCLECAPRVPRFRSPLPFCTCARVRTCSLPHAHPSTLSPSCADEKEKDAVNAEIDAVVERLSSQARRGSWHVVWQ